ncbi:hypothetical protein MOF11_13410 [Bacillus haynesii]|uniref:hypothetical protein n=1 Tax=Bacillus haynesii TaxID=1925021 RepID=UPI00227F3E84|nr:hypothetical protein [Bacillus haynesii]MCY9226022.1 hypothetical protein [Bacillus haynesii]
MSEYIKLIRFHNSGFNTTPYNSSSFCHSLPFINYEVTDLQTKNAVVNEDDFIRPKIDDQKWKGCFVFLEEYDKNLLIDGALVMRESHKKNVAYLKAEGQTIWVRNTAHTGKEDRYVNQYIKYSEHEGKQYEFYEYIGFHSNFYWVKMKIDLALKRLILGKRHFGYVPEWLSECYMMEHQVKEFKTSKLFGLKEQAGRVLSFS